MKELRLILPIYQKIGRKNVLISMNWYRNAHFQISGNIKQIYKKIIFSQVCNKGFQFNQFITEARIFYKNSGSDPSNVDAVMQKFLLDPLQDFGVIPEDNAKYHTGHCWRLGGQDKENPRYEVVVRSDFGEQ